MAAAPQVPRELEDRRGGGTAAALARVEEDAAWRTGGGEDGGGGVGSAGARRPVWQDDGGAGDKTTRPYKTFCRGRYCYHPPLLVFFKIYCKVYYI